MVADSRIEFWSGCFFNETAQPNQGFPFNLSDTFARKVERLADLMQGHGIFSTQSVAQAKNSRLAVRHLSQKFENLVRLVLGT